MIGSIRMRRYKKGVNDDIKTLLINCVLVLVAIVIFALLFPFGMLSKIISSIYNITTGNFSKFIGKTTNMALSVATSINQFGNTLYLEFFNAVLIKDKTIYPYGNPDDTISYVTGINKVNHNLSLMGRTLDRILDFFDTNHTIMTIVKVDGEDAVPEEFKKYIT